MKYSAKGKVGNLRSAIKIAALCVFAALFLSACVSRKVSILERNIALLRIKEPILVLPPLTSDFRLSKVAINLGKYYSVEVPKRVDGPTVYASNIDSLKTARDWNNLIKNGTVNTMEAAMIAKTVGCNSALTCQILVIQQYPPFRMVLQLLWIDSDTGNIIGKLYQDVDLSDSETKYRFGNFVGQGIATDVYEQIFYSEDRFHSSYLMPQEFFRFVAAYSVQTLFGDVESFPWWWFWRTVG